MELVKDVPLWAVRRICKAGGERHRKRTTPWEFQNAMWRSHRHRGVDSRLPAHYGPAYNRPSVSTERSEAVPAGNLYEADYRFYKGATEIHSLYRKCRWCHQIYFSAREGEVHKEKTHCFTNLRIIFSMLLAQRPMQCAVCGVITANQRWGLPLCSDACIYSWKFDAFDSHRWDAMVELALNKGLVMEDKQVAAN